MVTGQKYLKRISGFRGRRILRPRNLAIGIAVTILLILLWTVWWEPSRLYVVRQTIAVQPWRAEHSGLRIALISDLHIGAPNMSLASLRHVVTTVNAEKPDLVL